MNCRDVEERLDACVEGTLTDEECAALEKHVDSCSECRRLLAAARGEIEFPAKDRREFTESVLGRTAGASCVRARELLCDHVDGHLGFGDSELVRGHLDQCKACADLAVSLSELQNELPAMAEIEPDPFFAAAVVRRLSALRERPADPWGRARQWWKKLVRRPRFSWEAAYIFTLVLVLAFGNPFSPSYGSLRSSSSQLAAPGAAWQRVSKQIPQVWEACADRGGQAAADVALNVSSTCSAAEQFVSKVRQEIAALRAFGARRLEEARQLWKRGLSRYIPRSEPRA